MESVSCRFTETEGVAYVYIGSFLSCYKGICQNLSVKDIKLVGHVMACHQPLSAQLWCFTTVQVTTQGKVDYSSCVI